MHLHAALPQALAGLAPAAGHIEAERARREPAGAGLGHLREELADVVEDARIRRRRRARRGADRLLIDEDHLVDFLEPLHRIVLPRLLPRRMQPPGERPPEHLQDERRLAAAARARDGREHAQRKPGVDILERAMADAADLEPVLRLAAAVLRLPLHDGIAGAALPEIRPRHALLRRFELLRRRMGDDGAALAAAARAEVERVIGGIDDIAVVLDHDERVAEVAEFSERADELVCVAGVEADRGLVEHVEHAGKPAAHLRRQPDPLQLAAGKAPRGAIHVEILEAHVHEEVHPRLKLPQQVAGDLFFWFGERD